MKILEAAPYLRRFKVDIEEVKEAIRNSSLKTRIYIGCDSKVSRKKKVRFATVVILHIEGKHGGRLFSRIETERHFSKPTEPRLRLVQEAQKAVAIAFELMDVIGERHFELHLDLNSDPKYKSNAAVKEAAGYVFGSLGIEAKIKPEAFAASSAADALVQ